MTDFTELAIFHLASGAHSDPEKGLCAMEAVAWLEGLPHSDHPGCTCPIIGAYVRRLNDSLPDAERQRLVAYLPRLVGTVSPQHEGERCRYLISRAFGVHWPIIFRALKLNDMATDFERIGAEWQGAALADLADLADLARAARADLADLARADLAALAALAARAALADLPARAALYQAHFETLNGVLKIGAESPGFSKPIAPRVEKYRALIHV